VQQSPFLLRYCSPQPDKIQILQHARQYYGRDVAHFVTRYSDYAEHVQFHDNCGISVVMQDYEMVNCCQQWKGDVMIELDLASYIK